MQIVSFPEAGVPPTLRAQMVALQDQAWPGYEAGAAGPTHDPAMRPVSMLLVDSERVVSALDILAKEIVHRDERYSASGLSTVVTDEALRGKGFGRRLVVAAREAIEASGVDLGIFTCDTPLQAFYERCGWELLPGTVLVGGTPAAPSPSDQFDKVTLARFFSPRARDVAPTFVGERIELYPGMIDKLW